MPKSRRGKAQRFLPKQANGVNAVSFGNLWRRHKNSKSFSFPHIPCWFFKTKVAFLECFPQFLSLLLLFTASLLLPLLFFLSLFPLFFFRKYVRKSFLQS
ncbi:hypothetical protein K1719_046414 [Acacia pycnantha]|nr:hypothetical protein K1719_046414 [Acacia pycnantha]